jgi:DNA replication protein DnaC
MSQYIPQIKRQAARLRLSGISASIMRLLEEAQQNSPSYDEFIYNLFDHEVKGREAKQLMLKMKLAKLPLNHNLDCYDFTFASGLSATQLNQLRELNWLDQCYNIMLSGPSGTGKPLYQPSLL